MTRLFLILIFSVITLSYWIIPQISFNPDALTEIALKILGG